jgi:uncharacterized protein HemY
MTEEKGPGEFRGGFGPEAEAELHRRYGKPARLQSAAIIEAIALGDHDTFKRALGAATPEQRDAALVLLRLLQKHELEDKAGLDARMDQLLAEYPRLDEDEDDHTPS